MCSASRTCRAPEDSEVVYDGEELEHVRGQNRPVALLGLKLASKYRLLGCRTSPTKASSRDMSRRTAVLTSTPLSVPGSLNTGARWTRALRWSNMGSWSGPLLYRHAITSERYSDVTVRPAAETVGTRRTMREVVETRTRRAATAEGSTDGAAGT